MSDFLVWSSAQLLAPIFAIFITDRIHGSLEAVGIASTIYLLVNSVFELPVGFYIDRSKSETDDLVVAISGTLMAAAIYFCYPFITQIWQVYLLQGLLGLSSSIAFPGWYSIFTKHIDKDKIAFEWSFYDVMLGLGMAGTAALGGFLATVYGFNVVFLIISIITAIGALLLLLVRR